MPTKETKRTTRLEPVAKEHAVVAVYDTHGGAEAAIQALHRAGLDMTRLSIVGTGFHTESQVLGFYTAGDRMRLWGGRGAFWGALGGLLVGQAIFLVPAIGPLVVMGPLVGWIAGVLEGAAAGGAAGVLAGALASIGLPDDSVVKYELEVKAGRYLVMAHGAAGLIEAARTVLATTGASQVKAHVNHGRPKVPGLLPAHAASVRTQLARATPADAAPPPGGEMP